MRRIERWIITLVLVHAFMLLATQIVISNTDVPIYIDSIHKYIGVFKSQDYNKSIDQLLKSVLSF
ncbi:DUF5359 family protein [Aquibacillus koreensis]|uniref:DUF5359 family protein n=1 Tax=Aquibacillus koreensis TaxID=279446 RepID=UPI0038995422